MTNRTGSCLCGAVRYELAGDLRDVIACHCTQCRKTSGHFVSATRVANDEFRILTSNTLKWFRSSDEAERGFCSNCGSNLFWRRLGAGQTSIFAGTIDGATGLRTSHHIFIGDKGDYYDISDA